MNTRWVIACDVPTCEASLEADGFSDQQAERRLLQLLRLHGWQVNGEEHRCRHHRLDQVLPLPFTRPA